MRHDLEFINIPNIARKAARAWPDGEAIVDAEIRWTFAEVERRMIESVKAAISVGIGPGDRAALWAPNMASWIIAAMGIQGAGGILVPLNTRFKAQEIEHVLTKSGAKTLICIEDFLGTDYVEMLKTGAPELFETLTVVSLGETRHDGVLSWSEYIAGGREIDDEAVARSIDAITADDLSDIMFTSGTTGAPKGVQLTHGQSLRVFGWLGDRFTFQAGDCYIVVPPFFHTFGYKAGWMCNLMFGVTTIPQRTFDVDEILQTIQDEHVTIVLGPPTLFTDLINSPRREEFDLSSLRVTCPSAANVPVELIHQLKDVLNFESVFSAYGLTEATSVVTVSALDDDPEDVANSAGRPIDDVEVIVAGPDGNPVPTGEVGEVLVRGYNVMRGYWEDPAATAEVIDEDGWLHTGDIGRFNERGFLSITDRLKDMIIVGGFNVYPAEVERILLQHGGIAHAAVVGAMHPRYGEVAVAYVVPMPGASLEADEVMEFARSSMANFKVPRGVEVVDDLPRNASMKVLKAELRERAAQLFAEAGTS